MKDGTDTPEHEHCAKILGEEGRDICGHRQRDADGGYPCHGGWEALGRPFGDITTQKCPDSGEQRERCAKL